MNPSVNGSELRALLVAILRRIVLLAEAHDTSFKTVLAQIDVLEKHVHSTSTEFPDEHTLGKRRLLFGAYVRLTCSEKVHLAAL